MIKHNVTENLEEEKYTKWAGVHKMYSVQSEISFLTNIRNLKWKCNKLINPRIILFYITCSCVKWYTIKFSLSYLTDARHYFLNEQSYIKVHKNKDNLRDVFGDDILILSIRRDLIEWLV